MSAILVAAGFLQHAAAIRPLYLAIWCALAVLSVVLVVSMRSRWGRKNPLYRCAVLSLLVHFFLAGLTMTMRLVVGDGGSEMGPPIHVRLVDDVSREGPVTLAAPPPLLVAEEAKPASEPVADIQEKPFAAESREIEPPPLLAPPEPAKEKKTVLDASNKTTPAPIVEDTVVEPAAPVEVETGTKTAKRPAPAPVETDVAGEVAPATSPYARRNAANRLQWAEQQGGGLQTEAAVAAALAWLANAQSADGRWDASRFGAGVELAVLGQDRGGAGSDADTGISALALLALLGAGHSHQDGDYQSVVGKGLEFLMRGQAGDGSLAGDASLYARMYCHSMATFAMAEALAMTGDKRLESAVRRAVNYSLRAQHPATGGWRYRAGDTGDTSQLGWQLMSLWSAERAGIKIPPQTWTGAERFLRSVRRGRNGGLASYRPDGPASTPMTAEAMYCQQLIGEMIGGNGGDEAKELAAAEGTAQLLLTPPEPRRINLYYWYYGTLALHYRQQTNSEAASAWQSWNSALTTALLDTQLSDGPEAGSWEPNCVWGGYGGRVYTTAVAALCLEVYYRYAPLPSSDQWTASRPEIRRLPR